jgi:hypothetical protein
MAQFFESAKHQSIFLRNAFLLEGSEMFKHRLPENLHWHFELRDLHNWFLQIILGS